MQPRISMITLGVKDLTRSIKFYTELGFSRRGEQDDVAFFDLDGTWLGLYNLEALADDAQVNSGGQGFNAFTLSHNVKSEAECVSVIDHAISIGATLVKKPQKVSWGGFSGYFSDPDGHLWEVAVNPFTWIGPADSPPEWQD